MSPPYFPRTCPLSGACFPPRGPSGWFPRFLGVGSEVARSRASHRPPLKLHVRFSRMQLSRRFSFPELQWKGLTGQG